MAGIEIQLALDTTDTATAVAAARAAAGSVSVIEAGTVLCLSEGLDAVRVLRASFPTHPLVADIRIGRAGAKFARMAFEAGADRVTVLAETPSDVLAGALATARDLGREVEVELGERWTGDDVARWVDWGVSHIIAHRSGRYSAEDDDEIRSVLDRLADRDLGQTKVTLAGGLGPGDVKHFCDQRFDVVAVGSAIVQAHDPAVAARELLGELNERSGNRVHV